MYAIASVVSVANSVVSFARLSSRSQLEQNADPNAPSAGQNGAPRGYTRLRSPPEGLLQLAWTRYLKALSKKPLRTKALTSACIAGLSDVIAQFLLTGAYSNFKRTIAVACFGALWSGPSAHYWQKFLEHLFAGKKDMVTVLKKVVVDQLTYGPVCNLLFMSFATLVLEGRTPEALRHKISRDYVGVQLNGWRLWPLAALINYRFVPLQFRVLFINVVALLWTTFLIAGAKGRAAVPVAVKAASG